MSNDLKIHSSAKHGYSEGAAAYEASRPGYPIAAVNLLFNQLGLSSDSRVVEVGAGTGKFTALLAERTEHVTAVEPVEAMRTRLAIKLPSVRIVSGAAEALPLEDASQDSLYLAQTFHWCATARTVSEFARVLRPDGGLGLLWNVRDESVQWVAELTALVDSFAGDTPRYRTMQWRETLECAGLFSPLKSATFRHAHNGTDDTVVDRVLSTSFVAALPQDARERIAAETRKIIAPYVDPAGRLDYPYETAVYWAYRL